MNTTEREQLKALADLLITTLGDMAADEADQTVEAVAAEIYNNLLGVEGSIEKGNFVGYICIMRKDGSSHGGAVRSDRKFVPKKKRP